MVEDNDSLREATVDFLSRQGHQVSGLVCAEDVDDTPTRDVPDLYVIDVNLPGESGFSLAERIRSSQPRAGIVLMTAAANFTIGSRATRRGRTTTSSNRSSKASCWRA